MLLDGARLRIETKTMYFVMMNFSKRNARTRQRVQYFIDSYCISLITIRIVTPNTALIYFKMHQYEERHTHDTDTDAHAHSQSISIRINVFDNDLKIVRCPRFILQNFIKYIYRCIQVPSFVSDTVVVLMCG